MKLTLASKEFLKEIEVRKYTPKTIRSYRNNLNLFLCYCAENGVEDTEDITLGTVKGFAFFMSSRGRKGTYINSLLKSVKSFIQYCYDEEYGCFNTRGKFVWCKEEKPIIRTFQPKDVKRMLSHCSGRDFLSIRDRAVLTTFFETGIRCWELCCIKNADIYEDFIIIHGKNHKQRVVPITAVLHKALIKYEVARDKEFPYPKNDYYFVSFHDYQLTNSAVEHNSVKTFGNIVCFRNLQKETDDAIALFGDKNASGIVLMKSYNDYYYGYDDENGKHQKGYEERIAELIQKYPLGTEILGERAKKDFIVSFGNILRLRNILSTFDNFAGNEILSPIDFQDYTGIYNDLYIEFRTQTQKENIDDDIVFEMELVKQIEVNIDYILMLVAKYHKSNCEDKEILIAIDRAIKSSIELRSKKELIENFIATINTQTDVNSDWKKFVLKQKETDLSALIADEKLKDEETRRYMENAFRDGAVKTTGTDIDKLMPPVSRFGGGNRAAKKQGIIEKIQAFFEKYFGIV